MECSIVIMTLVVIELNYVGLISVITNKILIKVVRGPPEEIFCHVPEAVSLTGKQDHVEPFVCTDERIYHPECVAGMNIIVYVATG